MLARGQGSRKCVLKHALLFLFIFIFVFILFHVSSRKLLLEPCCRTTQHRWQRVLNAMFVPWGIDRRHLKALQGSDGAGSLTCARQGSNKDVPFDHPTSVVSGTNESAQNLSQETHRHGNNNSVKRGS